MSRIEFLKKFVAFNKRHKIPLPIIKLQLYVILVVCFIHHVIVSGLKMLKEGFCYPFRVAISYCKENIRTIFQIECLVVTIGICVLLVAYHGSVEVSVKTGALAAENYEKVAVGAEDKASENELYIEMDTGSVTVEETVEEIAPAKQLPYKIMVNRQANCITVYTTDEQGQYTVPYKAMICSTGGEETPVGEFGIIAKYDFKELFFDSYGQYCSRIYGPILFHSSGNNSMNKNDLNAADYNNLGLSVSHGCIRLTVADAKWIYDNCPEGTQVVIYDSEDPGPLGKPESIKVPEGTVWDPTDPDEANPWKQSKPRIEGVSDRILYEGDIYDLYEGVVAYDTCGNVITGNMVVESTINMDIPGDYKVTYYVKDLLGKEASVTAIYTVR